MADINERVVVDTDQAQTNLKDLKETTGDADTALDELKSTAGKVDQEEVSIPIETPGAKQAATDLGEVDNKARAAGEGAKIGTQHISDMVGPFGDASGAASTFGQAVEGAGGIVETMAAKLGLSESATGKLTAALGLAAVGVAAGAAAWSLYNASQDAAKKGADEMTAALGTVYDKLREGDAQAAAKTFVDTMGDKIDKFRTLIGGSVTKADIAGVLFGDPASIAKVDEAVGHLDGTTRVMAEGTIKILKTSWDDAKASADQNIALTDKVAGFFGTTKTTADAAKASLDGVAGAYDGVASSAAKATTPAQTSSGVPLFDLMHDPVAGASIGVYNVFPPANTPIAVDQATRRQSQIQGPR